MTPLRSISPRLLKGLLLLLPMQGCSGESLPCLPLQDGPLESTGLLFVEGLGTGTLEVGERRTLRLGWDPSLGGSPAELSVGEDPSGALSLLPSAEEGCWTLLALGEGEASVRARVGRYVRELPVLVLSGEEMAEGGVMRTLSSRVEVEGLPREGLLWTLERCPVRICLDGDSLAEDRCRIWADSLRDEARPDGFTLPSAGMHVLTAEADSPRDGILYTRRAVASFGKDVGPVLPLSLKVSVTAGDERMTVYSSGSVALASGGILRLADYGTLRDFAFSHATRRPGIEITLRPLSEWHRVGVDCSQLVDLTDRYTGRSLRVRINGREVSSGVVSPEL